MGRFRAGMPKLSWYWHRLRAMEPAEILAHLHKKFLQGQDTRRLPDWSKAALEAGGLFPALPRPEAAPAVLREALARDAKATIAGHWKAFGQLELQVDDPPRWHKDYLAGKTLATDQIAFKLNHRELPDGADIKLIWELSRWHPLTRLAMAAYVLGEEPAAQKCLEWLNDWVKHNPPYRGWNWASALEVGLRLAQFTWIDALLEARTAMPAPGQTELERLTKLYALRRALLPPHVWFAWRYRSFGSSANNHLIGELAGLILAVARWSELAEWSAPLDQLQQLWEREVLSQFAGDGGNREQALNYHLFSWEFCWQARAALVAVGRRISPAVEDRLRRAAQFFCETQVRREPWDYGDSDNAFVAPFFISERTMMAERRDWLRRSAEKTALEYWLKDPPRLHPPPGFGQPVLTRQVKDWWVYPDTGLAVCESGFWFLRWDLSPLGYLSTAAHGHFDALHLSIWFDGVAIVIDPGTGAYYADSALRAWLASRAAHNGPCPVALQRPRRLGTFLWSGHHPAPAISEHGPQALAEVPLSGCMVSRSLERSKDEQTWTVSDSCRSRRGSVQVPFTVRWQFAPGAVLKRRGDRSFVVNRQGIAMGVEAGAEWTEVRLVEAASDRAKLEPENSIAGVVSPAFRQTLVAPYLLLVARPGSDKPCVFRTTFLACGRS